MATSGKELTTDVKNKVLSYLRFKRNCIYIATEVGVYNSDILAISRKSHKLIEVETKISLADFKNDFKKSYRRYGREYKKHQLYANAENSKSIWIPNYFYFAVPEKIHDKVLRLLSSDDCGGDGRDKCGLILVDDTKQRIYDRLSHCVITKKAGLLHSKPIDEKVLNSIVMRMSSELITNRKRLAALS